MRSLDAAALDRVRERVRLHCALRVAWLRHLWGSGAPPASTVHGEVDAVLENRDDPADQERFVDNVEGLREVRARLAEVDEEMASDSGSRLAELSFLFRLSPVEKDALHTCLAVALEPSLRRVYAYLHDDASRPWASGELVQQLFGHPEPLRLAPESALLSWSIIHALPPAQAEDPHPLRCDPWIVDWLLDRHGIDGPLVGRAEPVEPLPPLADWPVRATADRLETLARSETSSRVRVRVEGPDGSGRRTFAACVAEALGLGSLAVHSGADPGTWAQVYVRAQRQAFLDHAAITWSGPLADTGWPEHIRAVPVQFHVCEPGVPLCSGSGFVDHVVALPRPGREDRKRLWSALVPAARSFSPAEIDALAEHHRVWVGDLVAVAKSAVESPEAASVVLRERARQRVGELAEHLPCTFQREDLVLPAHIDQTLDELIFEARDRNSFWEQSRARRLFPLGRGLLALFSGDPGTGKTMAAQVLAHSIGVDLFRVNLATLVSKYVGETSKNIQRILSQTAPADVALLFDEGDALFGSRTEVKDAHDRYANETTAHLLQAIEAYPGLAILTTNRRVNIDHAFVRRLRYLLEFPRPEPAQRSRIWQRLVLELAGPECGERLSGQLEALAANAELSGAQIKYAVLTALFLARQEGAPLGAAHLLRGVQRELEKEGRGLSHRERERLVKHAS